QLDNSSKLQKLLPTSLLIGKMLKMLFKSEKLLEGRVDPDLGFAVQEENFDRRLEITDGDVKVQGFLILDLQYLALEKFLEKIV
ncbi:17872_t:CDS:2, partial [Gigaspora margarita]